MGAMKPTLDSLQLLSPNSRDAALGSLQRKALQELAKEAGLRANAKSIEIVESLSELLQQRTSDTAAMMWSSISNPMFDEAKAPAQDAGKRREPSPEELSDLDRAVAQAQASQGDLSPSLLTIVPARPSSVTGMESPMQRAFERGRKSGLWQGSTEVALRQLERQWDSYKDTSNRKWSLPRLEDVQAKSDALADSGFTTVDSPNIRTSTKQGLNLAPSSGTKRKAREEDTEGQEQRPSAPKSAKQHRGQAPSHRQPRAACFSPLRPKNTPVFRPTATPERCTLMTKPDAACRDTPRPLGLPPRPDTTPGKGLKAAAPVDRARKAEAAFAARRAAAMAKGKSGK
ncbi:hypothetical protein WJX72_006589 [[Myrmecia] bisecta]|uniref:Uncharacterized protein n=1 Tax=[Myrmecia] bisecta TaxID=41462 RepID=A0AAW1PDS4_9CHLO